MQSISFVKSLQEIIRRLRVQEISEKIESLIGQSATVPITEEFRQEFASLIFESREGYASFQNSTDVKSMIESLNIGHIYDPKQLSMMLTVVNTQPDSAAICSTPAHFALFQTFLSNLKVMIAFSQTLDSHLLKQKVNSATDTERMFEIEIIEYDSNGVSLNRFGAILDSLQKLHQIVAKIVEDRAAKLSIAYMDSGSDFLLGLQSSFKVVEIMRMFFYQYWQKVRFKAVEEFERNIEWLGKGLNLIQHINRQEKNGVFDPDTSQKLKYSVLEEMTNLVGLGVVIKDYENEERYEKRKLVADKRDLKLAQILKA